MKKILTIVFSVILLAAFAVNASAAGLQVFCDASASSIQPGDQIVLTVSVSGAAAAKAALIEVSYGSDFDILSGKWLKSGALLMDFNGEDGVIAFAEETDLNGTLFQLTLKAKATAAGVQPVSAAVTLKNGADDVGSGAVATSIAVTTASASTPSAGGKSSANSSKTPAAASVGGKKTVSSVSSDDTVSSDVQTDDADDAATDDSAPNEAAPVSTDGPTEDSVSSESKTDNIILWGAVALAVLAVAGIGGFVIVKKKR